MASNLPPGVTGGEPQITGDYGPQPLLLARVAILYIPSGNGNPTSEASDAISSLLSEQGMESILDWQYVEHWRTVQVDVARYDEGDMADLLTPKEG